MKIPQTLTAALLSADEEYLIALCNKGTLNRAKKDLATIQPEVKRGRNRYPVCRRCGMYHYRSAGKQHLYLP